MSEDFSAPDSIKNLMARKPIAGERVTEDSSAIEIMVTSENSPNIEINAIEGQDARWAVRIEGSVSSFQAERLDFDADAQDSQHTESAPFLPNGLATSYIPRLASVRRTVLFRAVSGREVKPLSSHIFDGESRNILYDRSYPWRCIGSVGDGTGTLVGPRLVLTAAHCIDFPSKYPAIFHPGRSNLNTYQGPRTAQVTAWLRGSESGHVCANDFAIGVLSEPLGLTYGWMGTKSFNDDWVDLARFTHVGLRGGVLPSWQTGISVEDVDDGPFETVELETRCDTESGQSGGPLFAFWDGLPYIVGVLSGYEEEFSYTFPLSFTSSSSVFAGGLGMVQRVLRMRAEFD